MLINQTCVECRLDISRETADACSLNIDPKVFTNNQVHATCLGKAAVHGLFTPAVVAGLRGSSPSDLAAPGTLTGKLFQLGMDLELNGALQTPLGPNTPLRHWLVHSNVDTFTGNTQVTDQVHGLLKRHLDQFPNDRAIYNALVEREVLSNVSAEEALNPPVGIQVSCVTLAPGNLSAGDLAALEAHAIRDAQRKLRNVN